MQVVENPGPVIAAVAFIALTVVLSAVAALSTLLRRPNWTNALDMEGALREAFEKEATFLGARSEELPSNVIPFPAGGKGRPKRRHR